MCVLWGIQRQCMRGLQLQHISAEPLPAALLHTGEPAHLNHRKRIPPHGLHRSAVDGGAVMFMLGKAQPEEQQAYCFQTK